MGRICAGAFRLVPTEELVPYVNNARLHGEEQISQLRASMREFGFLSPIVIDGENNILAGHGRLMAARAEGMVSVPCV
ncbi:MAG: ParB/Srx family N-terminal domain-containing protein, partial [Oscillospiraceae bacterium]